MNRIPIFLLAVLVSSCSTLPQQYAASPSRILAQGVVTGKGDAFNRFMFGQLVPGEPTRVTRVQIRSVDGGDVIWVRGHHLGDKVWLEPGVHKLSVMCSTSYSWGTIMVGTDVDVDVQTGYTYCLAASALKSVSDKPHVEVAKKESKS